MLGIDEVSSIVHLGTWAGAQVGPRPWVYPPTAENPRTCILQYFIGNLLSNTYNKVIAMPDIR